LDLKTEIRKAVDSGEVFFGFNNALKLLQEEKAQVVVVSNNIEEERKKDLSLAGKEKIIEFPGDNNDLGRVCGKPFAISTLAITKLGKSKIMGFVGGENENRK